MQKNLFNQINFSNQVQLIRLFSDYFKRLNKKTAMFWVCNAPKKSDKSIFSAKTTKNFTEFTKVHDKQAFTGRKKNSVYCCFLKKVLEFC